MLGGEIFLGEVFRHLGNVGMFCLKRKGQLLGRFGQKTDVYFGLKPGEKKRGKKRKKREEKTEYITGAEFSSLRQRCES